MYDYQLSFGQYIFPLTFQETSRLVTLDFDKKKIPFNYGESVALNTGPSARDIVISGPVGSMLQGSAGNVLATAADLETERRILAGLQLLGRSTLHVGTQQFIYAFLESFEHKFWQDAYGMRYADWTLKFYCDDPRYISTTPTVSANAYNAGTINLSTNGNVRTYPILTFNCGGTPGVAPYVILRSGVYGTHLNLTFSLLTMAANSQLVISCDPRPNVRSACCAYTPSGAATVNALQYITIENFSENDYDLTEWFPFINPPQVEAGMELSFGFTSGGSGTFIAQWNDLWL